MQHKRRREWRPARAGSTEHSDKPPLPILSAKLQGNILTFEQKDDDAVLKFEMKPIGEGRAGLKILDTPIPIKPIRFERRETQRAVTPFGGIAVFISFLGKIGFVEAIRQHMPIRWRSPNPIDPSFTFTAFLVAVLVRRSSG